MTTTPGAPAPHPPVDLSKLRIRKDDPPRRRGPGAGVVAVAILVVAAGIAAPRVWKQVEARRKVAVETTRVVAISPTDADQMLTATGYIVARVKADVSSRIVGRLAELNVEEGTRIRKGAVVARLEDSDYRAAVAEADANLGDLLQQRARQARLVSEGIASQAELDSLEMRVGAARARVDLAKANLEYTVIRAPFDGVVLTKKAKVGETVAPGGFSGSGSSSSSSAIATLADFGTLEVEADVAEANIGKVSPGLPAEISVQAIPERPFRGHLDRIVPTADRTKATVQVKVRFDETDQRLLPEMQATVKFLKRGSSAKPGPSKLVIPAAAVVQADGRNVVRVVVDGRLGTSPVDVVPADGGMFEVKAGLSAGDEIVTGGAVGIPDGRAVDAGGATK